MADKNDYNGVSADGAVRHESFCMPSMEKENVDQANRMTGRYDMSDLANTKPYPTEMSDKEGVRRNMQPGPTAANPMRNDRSE
jgi:hypothetical protein